MSAELPSNDNANSLNREAFVAELDRLIAVAPNLGAKGVLMALRATMHEEREWVLLEHCQEFARQSLEQLQQMKNTKN